ncbi:hypothetical protein BDV95DRAFT_595552 [Massariosphaeria phaeospora]|uniref:Uncharacterized protein n=1 Tax=Massariosphaeria phaeospora TaxID=100035 RepID=A0A7C8M5A0_9PLEO|nr:hypothetical protein BDV95DRAFT_595552 [Massariosphaeria phaeospora]
MAPLANQMSAAASQPEISTAATPPHSIIKPSDPKVGPIPVAVFVVLCMMGPFMLSFIVFVVYKFTIGKYRHNKQLRAQELEVELANQVAERPAVGARIFSVVEAPAMRR